MSETPPCAETGAKDRYTATNDDAHEYICSYCGQTMKADPSTYMNHAREMFRPARFRYAGHYFYWRG